MNFESTATQVFQRLIFGDGPGLYVLWGGLPNQSPVNKTYFLETIKAFEKSPVPQKPFVSSNSLLELLAQLKPFHYQCVTIKGDYSLPLAVAVPLALAEVAYRPGLVAGRKIVILCDDIHQFMEYENELNKDENEQFLVKLARALDTQTTVTFLGTSRLSWNAKAVIGSERALPLGWD